jgi:ArsR family transcriptional regulator, zinc-responsive transcriptional repressor
VDLLKALASPVRLAAIVELGEGPRCVHELLLLLRESGRSVTATRRGTEITYELADVHVGHIVDDAIRHSQEEHRGTSTKAFGRGNQ